MQDNYSAYMSFDLEQYAGQWVGIVDAKLVAHGQNAKDVYENCKKQFPSKVPFLACVPKAIAMIL